MGPRRGGLAGGIVPSGSALVVLLSSVALGRLGFGLVLIVAFGLGMAVAVLIDATIVRMLLVPAVMELCGKANWWMPGRRAPKATSASQAGVGEEVRV